MKHLTLTLKYKGRSILERKVPKITVRWRLKYQNSRKCKQIAEICKQTAVKNEKKPAVFGGKSFRRHLVYKTVMK